MLFGATKEVFFLKTVPHLESQPRFCVKRVEILRVVVAVYGKLGLIELFRDRSGSFRIV
jgi:hypothetical protein